MEESEEDESDCESYGTEYDSDEDCDSEDDYEFEEDTEEKDEEMRRYVASLILKEKQGVICTIEVPEGNLEKEKMAEIWTGKGQVEQEGKVEI